MLNQALSVSSRVLHQRLLTRDCFFQLGQVLREVLSFETRNELAEGPELGRGERSKRDSQVSLVEGLGLEVVLKRDSENSLL